MHEPVAFSSNALNRDQETSWKLDILQRRVQRLSNMEIITQPLPRDEAMRTAVICALSAAKRYAQPYPFVIKQAAPQAPFATTTLADIQIWLRHHHGKWVELYQNYEDPMRKVDAAMKSGPNTQLCIFLSVEAIWKTGLSDDDFDMETGQAERRIRLNDLPSHAAQLADYVHEVAAEAFHKAYKRCPYGQSFIQELAETLNWSTKNSCVSESVSSP